MALTPPEPVPEPLNSGMGTSIQSGQVLTGVLFSEPMRVETVSTNGPDSWNVGLVGQQSGQFSRVTLSAEEFADLAITDATPAYDGDGDLLRLGLQAYSLGIAYEFDPYFALSVSRVDPLPHQLEAVYDYLLKLPSVRFLLATTPGPARPSWPACSFASSSYAASPSELLSYAQRT